MTTISVIGLLDKRGDSKNRILTHIIWSSGQEYYALILDNEALAKISKHPLKTNIGIIGLLTEDDCIIVQEVF